MPEEERARAIRLILTLIERNIGKPHLGRDVPEFVDLLPFLPKLGMPNEIAARLAPMITCDNPRIRPDVFQALAELKDDAGLDVVLSRMDYLFSRLPDIDASFVGEDGFADKVGRQRHADTVAFIYSVKGLLQAKSDENRKLGLGFLDRLRKKYADTEKGREIISSFEGEFQRLGVSLDSRDSLGVNVLNVKPTIPKTLSEKSSGNLESTQKAESNVERTIESESSVCLSIVLVAILALIVIGLLVLRGKVPD